MRWVVGSDRDPGACRLIRPPVQFGPTSSELDDGTDWRLQGKNAPAPAARPRRERLVPVIRHPSGSGHGKPLFASVPKCEYALKQSRQH